MRWEGGRVAYCQRLHNGGEEVAVIGSRRRVLEGLGRWDLSDERRVGMEVVVKRSAYGEKLKSLQVRMTRCFALRSVCIFVSFCLIT